MMSELENKEKNYDLIIKYNNLAADLSKKYKNENSDINPNDILDAYKKAKELIENASKNAYEEKFNENIIYENLGKFYIKLLLDGPLYPKKENEDKKKLCDNFNISKEQKDKLKNELKKYQENKEENNKNLCCEDNDNKDILEEAIRYFKDNYKKLHHSILLKLWKILEDSKEKGLNKDLFDFKVKEHILENEFGEKFLVKNVLVKNKKLNEALKNKKFNEALKNKKFNKALKNKKFNEALIESNFILKKILQLRKIENILPSNEWAKYTSLESTLKIFSDNKSKLRLNSSINFNDPSEGLLLNQILQEINSGNDKIKINMSSKDYKLNNTFITCFSKKKDNATSLPMWVTYAKDASGCCLIFKESFFNLTEIDDSPIYLGKDYSEPMLDSDILYEVFYLSKDDKDRIIESVSNNKEKINRSITSVSDNDKEKIIELLIRSFNSMSSFKLEDLDENNKEKINKIITSVNDKEKIIELLIRFFNFISRFKLEDLDEDEINKVYKLLEFPSFIFKTDFYKHEEEIRVIKQLDINDKKSHNLIKVRDGQIPELYIEMPNEINCEKVILGPKLKNKNQVANFLRLKGVTEVKDSEIEYK